MTFCNGLDFAIVYSPQLMCYFKNIAASLVSRDSIVCFDRKKYNCRTIRSVKKAIHAMYMYLAFYRPAEHLKDLSFHKVSGSINIMQYRTTNSIGNNN